MHVRINVKYPNNISKWQMGFNLAFKGLMNMESEKYLHILSGMLCIILSVTGVVDCVWNVMAHAQKPDFVFRRNRRVHLKLAGASVQSTTGSRGVRISGSIAGHTMFRGSVKGTGYPLHLPVSPSLPLPCVTMCHHISTGLYQEMTMKNCSKCVLWQQISVTVYTAWVYGKRDGYFHMKLSAAQKQIIISS
jgi:hypothetical protein